jgi:hypothetical protein
MNRFLKLLNWEINRFAKFYGVLLAITLISQLAGLMIFSNANVQSARNIMYQSSITLTEYAATHGKVQLVNYSRSSLWFTAPIALCATAMLLYVFLIWYREWYGKNTFAYRLLMLPTSRMNIYLAKASAIVLFALGLVAFQLAALKLQIFAFNSMVPAELREIETVSGLARSQAYLNLLIPRYFFDFVLNYGAGITLVCVLFTAIALERSYRVKGFIAGVAYVIAAVFLFLLPFILSYGWYRNYFYPIEVFRMAVAAVLLILICSLWLSSILMRKKITV